MALKIFYRGPSSRLETLIEKIQQNQKENPTELYSSQTSSSFPASEGFETPNSCTNDSDMKEKFNDNDKTMDTDEKTDKIAAVSGTKMDKSNKATKNGKDGCYQCQFCDKSFPRLGYLKKHEQSHAEHMPFKCEYCARLFKHKRSRDRHTKLHTGDRRYRCPHCESAFSRSDHLKIHMKTHDNQKPFQCTVCNRGYNTAAALTSHMQNHKKQAALAGNNASSMYNYSPRSTGSASSTNSHKRKYSTILDPKGQQQMSPQSAPATPAANINCFYCTKSDFISMEQLNLHIGTMHSNRLLSSPAEFHFRMQQQHQKFYENFQFPCEFCTMKFPTIEKVFHHIKVSHMDRIGSPSNYLEHFNRNLCSTYGISSGQENVGEDSKKGGDSEESSRKSDVADKEIKKEAEDNESVKEQETEEQPTDLSQPKTKRIKEEHGNDDKTCSSTPNSNERRSIEPAALPPSAFLCNQCNASLPDFESFRLHLRSHLEQNHHAGNNGISLMNGVFPSQNGGNFVCHQCGTTLENRDDYEHHIEKHFVIINSEFVCQCCNKFFPKSEDLQKHLNEQHVQTIFKCSLCKETFDTKISIQLHFAVQHSNEIKLYRCSVCLDVFRLEKEFKHHVRTRHLQQNAIQCVFCRVVCTSELEMHFHLAAHVKQFRCPACSESFHVEFLLDRHLQTHHSQKEINAAELKASASQSNSHLIKNSNFYNYQITNKFYPPEPFGSPSLLLNNNIYDSLRGTGHLYNSSLDSKKSGRDLLTPKSNLLNLYNSSQVYLGSKGEGAEESPSTSSTVKSSLYMPPVGTPHHLSQRYHQQNSMIRNLYEKAFQKATATNDSNNNNNSNNSSENDNNNNMHQLEIQKQQQQKFRASEMNGNDCGICERNDGAVDADHRKAAHNSKAGVSLKCAYCSGDFRSRTELENHMKIQHNIGGKHKCLICDEILPSPAVLAEHKLQHCKVGASGKCSLCSHPLQDINNFKQHLNKHGQQISTNLSVTKNKCANYEIPIQCICCRQILSSEFEITLHAKFHTKSPDINEERTCALCLEIIPKSNTKKICDSCIKKHNFTPAAGGHTATSSAGKLTENGNGSGSSENIPIQCNLCKKIQMNAYKLQEHLIEHTFQDCGSSSNGYVCYICTSIFTSAGGLQQHIHQEHEKGDMDKNIKPYDCNVCDARYFFRTELEHHVLEHEKNVGNKIPSSNFSAEDSQEDRNIKVERQSEKDDDSRNEVLKQDNGPDDDEYIEVEKVVDSQK